MNTPGTTITVSGSAVRRLQSEQGGCHEKRFVRIRNPFLGSGIRLAADIAAENLSEKELKKLRKQEAKAAKKAAK